MTWPTFGEWDIRHDYSRRVKIRRLAEFGMLIPPWCGVAYVLDYARVAVCYPIPLNLVVRFLRYVWERAEYPIWLSKYVDVDTPCAYCGGPKRIKHDTRAGGPR